jgi:hypothetical protein
MSLANLNRLKANYFEPFVAKILDFPPESIDLQWLRATNRWGMLSDETVEKKLPRLFLAQLEKRAPAAKAQGEEPSPENHLKLFSDTLAVTWALHQVHLPILNRWVRRNEESQ